jgi:hypothetical protein
VGGEARGVQSRNGMPEGGGYVYRGTGEDTEVTAGLGAARLRFEAQMAVPSASSYPKPARRRAVTRLPVPSPVPAPVPVAEPLRGARARARTGARLRGRAREAMPEVQVPGRLVRAQDRLRRRLVIRRLLAALYAKLTAGRLEPDQPHAYAPDRSWPGSCWCPSADQAAPVHGGRAGR